jgi:hypothetical protein
MPWWRTLGRQERIVLVVEVTLLDQGDCEHGEEAADWTFGGPFAQADCCFGADIVEDWFVDLCSVVLLPSMSSTVLIQIGGRNCLPAGEQLMELMAEASLGRPHVVGSNPR